MWENYPFEEKLWEYSLYTNEESENKYDENENIICLPHLWYNYYMKYILHTPWAL